MGNIFFSYPISYRLLIVSDGWVTILIESLTSYVFTHLSNSDRVYSMSPFGSSLSVYTFKDGFALTSSNQTLKFSFVKY